MRVGIIRTVGGLSVCTNASAIEPWFDVAAFPYSPASAFGIALDAVVLAFRVLRPIQRKAVAHKPFAKIVAADRTGRNGTAIRVEAERRAVDRTPGNECVKVVCCLHRRDPKRESESALGRPALC
jgi:hypothetical protein